jgi:predicted nucleotidyltransferase
MEAERHARRFEAKVGRELERREAAASRTQTIVREVVQRWGPAFGLERASLFGSLVWGDFDEERSDVDLMVWGLDQERAARFADDLRSATGRPVHVVRAETAAPSLLERAEREGRRVD